MADQEQTILVVGGGIAGTAVGMHVAEAGHRALIVDPSPVIGGSLLLLDKTYPTDSCGVCFMAPDPPAVCPFLECERDPRIDIRVSTQLVSLEGKAGAFKATLARKPVYVDAKRCDGCGRCTEVCPIEVQAGHLGASWLSESHKAIYLPFAQAVPATFVIDGEACNRCGECVKVCPQKAIDLEAKETKQTVKVASVVLTPGFGPNDAHVRGAYGYGEYANVVSSLEYERMLSTSSPSRGRPVRPSDGKPATRIAIIQCVGSRDQSCGVPYCSAACCMIGAKQASLTKKRNPEAEVAVFTMDVRAPGRGYEHYLAGVRELEGVSYRRSLVSGVKLDPQTQNLDLQFAEDGQARTECFNLVVLEVGMIVPPAVRRMAEACGIELNQHGFATTERQTPTQTSRAGVFVAGSFREPKDVPATVPESIAAAAGALQYAGALEREHEEWDAEKIATPDYYDRPLIGVFLDGEAADLAEALDIEALAAEAAKLTDVVHVRTKIAEKQVCKDISTHELTYVVLGTSSARRGEEDHPTLVGVPVMRVALGAVDAFVHSADAERANLKALEMIRMAVQAARAARPRPVQIKMPERRAVVLGGSAAGLVAARTLSSQGVETHLVEAGDALGGMASWKEGMETWVGNLIEQVEEDPLIKVHKQSELKSFGGEPGRMVSVLAGPEGEEEIAYGTLVVALDASEHAPEGFGLQEQESVITQAELTTKLAAWEAAGEADKAAASVAMILCADTRQGERLYCSRTCCADALKNALTLKAMTPETAITILYRDIVTPGFSEDLYQEARDAGVLFLRYTLENPPQVEGTKINVLDDVLGEEVALQPELLVLSGGIVPGREFPQLAEMLGLELDQDGFFAPLNIKSQPMDLNSPGMYLAGYAGGPATLEECLEQGMASGLRAALFVKRELKTPVTVASVEEWMCSGCGLCVDVCPSNARHMDEDEEVAKVDAWLCLGCGVCAAVCPNGASSIAHYEARGVLNAIDAALG
ncbi:MAG: FAD-dependent oxidoreductase [Anaerolineales bacterium]|jgi:heterodisulfide reductase subunit A